MPDPIPVDTKATATRTDVATTISGVPIDKATEVVDRQARNLIGMSNQLGVPVAWMFLMVVVFASAALIYFVWVVLPAKKADLIVQERRLGLEEKRQDVNAQLSAVTDKLSDDFHDHVNDARANGERLDKMIHLNERNQETTTAQWRVLTEIRDGLKANGSKPEKP